MTFSGHDDSTINIVQGLLLLLKTWSRPRGSDLDLRVLASFDTAADATTTTVVSG